MPINIKMKLFIIFIFLPFLSSEIIGCASKKRSYYDKDGKYHLQYVFSLDQTTTEGAIIGGVIGTGVAALIDPNFALIGTFAGLVGGGVWGNKVRQTQEEYAAMKEALDNQILTMRQRNSVLWKYNDQLGKALSTLENKNRQLRRNIRSKEISASKLKQDKSLLLKLINKDKKIMSDFQGNLYNYVKSYNEWKNETGKTSLSLEKEIEELREGLKIYRDYLERAMNL